MSANSTPLRQPTASPTVAGWGSVKCRLQIENNGTIVVTYSCVPRLQEAKNDTATEVLMRCWWVERKQLTKSFSFSIPHFFTHLYVQAKFDTIVFRGPRPATWRVNSVKQDANSSDCHESSLLRKEERIWLTFARDFYHMHLSDYILKIKAIGVNLWMRCNFQC